MFNERLDFDHGPVFAVRHTSPAGDGVVLVASLDEARDAANAFKSAGDINVIIVDGKSGRPIEVY